MLISRENVFPFDAPGQDKIVAKVLPKTGFSNVIGARDGAFGGVGTGYFQKDSLALPPLLIPGRRY